MILRHWGAPGLTSLVRYVKGADFDCSGGSGREWERDIDLANTVQSDTLPGVSFRLRNAAIAGDILARRDENRFIINYTVKLF